MITTTLHQPWSRWSSSRRPCILAAACPWLHLGRLAAWSPVSTQCRDCISVATVSIKRNLRHLEYISTPRWTAHDLCPQVPLHTQCTHVRSQEKARIHTHNHMIEIRTVTSTHKKLRTASQQGSLRPLWFTLTWTVLRNTSFDDFKTLRRPLMFHDMMLKPAAKAVARGVAPRGTPTLAIWQTCLRVPTPC